MMYGIYDGNCVHLPIVSLGSSLQFFWRLYREPLPMARRAERCW